MTLLRVHRKAADEADAQKLVDATYRLKDPLGTPILFLRPEEYEHFKGGLRVDLAEKLWDRAKVFMTQNGYRLDQDEFEPTEISGITDSISEALDAEYSKASCMWFNETCYSHAHHYEQDDYDPPACAIISAPRKSQTIDKLSKELLEPFENIRRSNLPVSNAQLQFYTLWHEIGHATGADEPQTETMSAIMCRRAFDNTAFLAVLSDLRAVRAIQSFDDDTQNEKYGWPMVDALDFIRNAPLNQIEALGEDDIKSLRFLRFDYNKAALKAAAHFVAQRGADINNNDLVFVTKDILNTMKNVTITDSAQSIVLRFSLAVQRLSIGADAYYDHGLEKDIWDRGYAFQGLPKDAPEYLTGPSIVSPV